MKSKLFRVIDPIATGANIVRLRKERGLSVRDLQTYFGFEEPQAIYKWQRGQSLPTVDNLYALGALLEVPMDEILVQSRPKLNILPCEQQADAACCSPFFPEYQQWEIRWKSRSTLTIFHPVSAFAAQAGHVTRQNGGLLPFAVEHDLAVQTGRQRKTDFGLMDGSAERFPLRQQIHPEHSDIRDLFAVRGGCLLNGSLSLGHYLLAKIGVLNPRGVLISSKNPLCLVHHGGKPVLESEGFFQIHRSSRLYLLSLTV